MSGLQEAFYIIGIVFMGIMLLLVTALVISVFIIRAKINRIHHNIEAKLGSVATLAEKGGEIASGVVRKAKRTLSRK